MSTINTNGIDVNYPVPGQNNSTQGFRNNFTNIKNNLDTAGTEITELQQKSVFKEGLEGINLNNDMANTLISNAAIRSFRHTTYNLGSSLSGTVLVNVLLGDVQYGTITGDTTIQFAGWAPINTESAVKLRLTIANNVANISFPGEVSFSQGIIENNGTIAGNLAVLHAPYDAGVLEYNFTTLDCGNSITVTPTNRPYQVTQISERTHITPTGFEGDRPGTIVSAPSIPPITVTDTTVTTDVFSTTSTEGFYVDMPITFTGNVFGGVLGGQTYYVTYIDTDTEFAVGRTVGGANLTLSTATGNMQATPVAFQYQCVGTYDSNTWVSVVTGSVESSNQLVLANTLGSPTTQYLNQPIIFADESNGANVALMGLDSNVVYYIKTVDSSTAVTVTRSRTNGLATGTTVPVLDSAPVNVSATVYYQGHDIWQQVALLSDSAIDQNLSLYNLQVNGELSLDDPSHLAMGGGLNGYFLQTDGAGNLSWVAGGGSGNGTVGGSNTQVQFNNGGSFAGSANFTFDGTTVSVTGNIDATGDISANNIGNITIVNLDGNVGNILAGDGTWISAETTTYGNSNVVALLDAFGSNAINTTGNVVAGYLESAGNLNAENGTVTGDVFNANLIDVNGNINALNMFATTGAFYGNIIGLEADFGNANIVNLNTETIYSNLTFQVSDVLTVDSYIQVSAASGLEGIGSVQGDALALTRHINEVSTVAAANTTGVALPKAYAGMRIVIRNSAGSNVKVYENLGDGGSFLANLEPSTSVEYFTATGNATIAGTWYTL